MKSFAIYWARVLANNPRLATAGRLTLTVEEFRKCCERAYLDAQKVAKPNDVVELLFGGRKP